MLGISERLDWWIFLVEMSCMIEGLTRPRMVRTSATTALRRTTSRDTTAPRQVIMSLSWSQLNIWLSQAWRVWRRGGWERLGRRRRGRGSWERLKPREDGRWGESGERESWLTGFIYRAVLVRVPRFTAWRSLKLSLWLLTRFIPSKRPIWGVSVWQEVSPALS